MRLRCLTLIRFNKYFPLLIKFQLKSIVPSSIRAWFRDRLFLRQFYVAQQKNSAYFSNNKSKFVSLRRILPILSFILLTAISSQGQSSRSIPPEVGDRLIKLYPNPATSFITFDLQKTYEKGVSIQVYSFLGKKMYENQNVTEKVTVDLNEFARGIYIYHLRDVNGKIIESGKFQVSR